MKRLLDWLIKPKEEDGRALLLRFRGASRIGSKSINQDNLRMGAQIPFAGMEEPFSSEGTASSDTMQVFCICDGVGGGFRGEAVARTALAAINAYLTERTETTEADFPQPGLRDRLIAAAEAAQRSVLEFCRHNSALGGCTLAMIGILDDQYVFLNIGDSPAYFLSPKDRSMRELSFRHNLAHLKLSKGIEPEEADHRRLLRYLGKFGSSAQEMAHICEGTVRAGDRILICTDGVAAAFPERKLKQWIKRGRTADRIVEKAEKMPDADNCTAICLSFERQRR